MTAGYVKNRSSKNMSAMMLGLPQTLWVNEICEYLPVADVLKLRLLNNFVFDFIQSLLPSFIACKTAKVARLQSEASEEVRSGETIVMLLEPLRQNIVATDFEARSLAEIAAYANPPIEVLQTLQAVVGLLGSSDLTWAAIKKENKSAAFLTELKAKLSAQKIQKVPRALRAKIEDLNPAVVASVSIACGQLLHIAQAFVMLQEGYCRTEVIEWFKLKENVKAVEKQRRVYEKVAQGMPKGARSHKFPEKAKAKKAGTVAKSDSKR